MSAQYLYDVPSWLLLASPHCWLERDGKAGFDELFIPQMELFIREVEKAESEHPPLDKEEPLHRLSVLMRESWSSGRFWFNYAMRTSIDADIVYWKALDDGTGRGQSDEEAKQLIDMKMKQFDAYEKEKEKDPRFR